MWCFNIEVFCCRIQYFNFQTTNWVWYPNKQKNKIHQHYNPTIPVLLCHENFILNQYTDIDLRYWVRLYWKAYNSIRQREDGGIIQSCSLHLWISKPQNNIFTFWIFVLKPDKLWSNEYTKPPHIVCCQFDRQGSWVCSWITVIWGRVHPLCGWKLTKICWLLKDYA